ncbi:hypothetical protein [Streptomyces beihaiensis]|uniref:Secreted protein n=1 Tax=Streptomyces beihaiensis TaxID=2984495 RepID=A0ABT3TMI0_9ACTN|nr:hypothetical protein [Streptomyces beihaiensis]MCX3058254.1 hypothetical protein [Streptomyces beihaiensis]
MSARPRLRALLIVLGALAATAMPTVAAFADPPPPPSTQAQSNPRDVIQPAADIVGKIARRTAERAAGKTLGIVPERASLPVSSNAPPVPTVTPGPEAHQPH